MVEVGWDEGRKEDMGKEEGAGVEEWDVLQSMGSSTHQQHDIT